jgi:hypothetical protein
MTQDELVALALSKLPAKRSLPGKCYVVLILGTEEFDVASPEIVGPFDSYRHAYAWIARLPNAVIAPADQQYAGHITLQPPQSSSQYAGWAIVGDMTATNPQRYMRDYDRIVMHPDDYDGLHDWTMLFGEHTGLPVTTLLPAWIALNREALDAHWRGELDSAEMVQRLKKLPAE